MARPPDHLEGKGHILVHGPIGQQTVVLEDAPDVASQVGNLPGGEGTNLLAGDPDVAAVGSLLFGHKPEERRLPDPDGPTMKTNSPRVDHRDVPEGR